MNSPPHVAFCRYSAFVSYSHEDEGWAKWLQSALENYRVPRRLIGTRTAFGPLGKRLAPVFRDRTELSARADLGKTITAALHESANLIVICSPTASPSRWVNEEIQAFCRLGRRDRIFCLIVAGEPNASQLPEREAEECFPPALRSWAEGETDSSRKPFEPIAADARPGRDSRTDVRLKIIAGLLDVGFDALKHREQRRRIRRLTIAASLSLVLTLITTGLAISARQARIAAERRQREAETLVDFMLGTLNDKLRQVQRLDILEAVDNQAMAYFLARPKKDWSDSALALHVKALQRIGNVREDQGKLPQAMESYGAAVATAAELMRRAPGDLEREALYAETLHHLGNAYWFQGDLDRALDSFQRAIALLERAAASRPTESNAALLAYARTNEGRVHEARGEFVRARALYEQVLATFVVLRTRHPGEIRWQSDRADAAESLAKVSLEQGELAQAITGLRDVYRLRTEIIAERPGDRDSQENLALTEGNLGRAFAECGDDDSAARYAQDAVRLARELVGVDPTQSDWRLELGKYDRLLGEVNRNLGRLEVGRAADQEATRVLGELVKIDSTNTTWRRELAVARLEAALLELAADNPGRARGLLSEAFAALESESSRANRTLQLYRAKTLIALGEAAARGGDTEHARERWQQAQVTLDSAAQTGADPEILATWTEASLLLDKSGEAEPGLKRLSTMGYLTPEFEQLLRAKHQAYRTSPLDVRCANRP